MSFDNTIYPPTQIGKNGSLLHKPKNSFTSQKPRLTSPNEEIRLPSVGKESNTTFSQRLSAIRDSFQQLKSPKALELKVKSPKALELTNANGHRRLTTTTMSQTPKEIEEIKSTQIRSKVPISIETSLGNTPSWKSPNHMNYTPFEGQGQQIAKFAEPGNQTYKRFGNLLMRQPLSKNQTTNAGTKIEIPQSTLN